MTINSISAFGSYYSSSIKVLDYETVKKQLQIKGIAPTGNESIDRALLSQSNNSENSAIKNISLLKNNSAQIGNTASVNQIPLEWQDLLSQLGLTTTGDINKDYDKAIVIVEQKIKYATTEEEKNKYTGLKSQINDFISNNSMNLSSIASAMVGASMLASINKATMIK